MVAKLNTEPRRRDESARESSARRERSSARSADGRSETAKPAETLAIDWGHYVESRLQDFQARC